MKDLGSRVAYWDTVGVGKTFTHPVGFEWPAEVGRDARVLDYGCGYGRVMGELSERGFSELRGVDVSDFDVVRERRLDVATMNGNRSGAVQLPARKR
ncbi:class I SAM-dependent methyltransferase [Streptomyces wedmorensis]|uniref:class I SAM-dependent methyltransferase n=1 Tax=Streptomyces wedmorensis TaxID=43759 RepID=UPI00343F2B92